MLQIVQYNVSNPSRSIVVLSVVAVYRLQSAITAILLPCMTAHFHTLAILLQREADQLIELLDGKHRSLVSELCMDDRRQVQVARSLAGEANTNLSFALPCPVATT